MYGLSESLRANVRLTVLDLSENVIGPKGARYVSEALMKNTTLQSINFEWTGLEAEGINYLITAMKTNTSSSITSLGGLGKKRKKIYFCLVGSLYSLPFLLGGGTASSPESDSLLIVSFYEINKKKIQWKLRNWQSS